MTHTYECVININCFYRTSWISDNNNFYYIFIIRITFFDIYYIFIIRITFFDIYQFKFLVKQIFLNLIYFNSKIWTIYPFSFYINVKNKLLLFKIREIFLCPTYRLF